MSLPTLDKVRAILETIRDQTYRDAEPPELRAQNEANYHRATEALLELVVIEAAIAAEWEEYAKLKHQFSLAICPCW